MQFTIFTNKPGSYLAMKYYITFLIILTFSTLMTAQSHYHTPFETNSNYTPTYQEVIEYYHALGDTFEIIDISPFGMTDSGFPLHEVVINNSKDFTNQNDNQVLFINNAIHPGEPCGVDASMLLVRDICLGKLAIPDNMTLVLVPFYNIGGGLNRSSHSRANQDGPEAYGFRGNAKNLDLNRDFVKCDSKNARTFNQLITKWNPHVMIDTHTSNGADYQYTMTLIATQKDKLDPYLSAYMTETMLPFLYKDMEEKRWEMIPYVYAKDIPDNGIIGFMDYPRYSSGYATLHNVISFMPETHMLKPYKDRVLSTKAFIESMITFLTQEGGKIIDIKRDAEAHVMHQESISLNWELDKENTTQLSFKGYAAKYKTSEVTGQDRLYYDHDEPFTKLIPFNNTYKPTLTITKPEAYIIPKGYTNVIERLKWNGINLEVLESDTTVQVEQYYISKYETVDKPYEGHYLHYNVETRTVNRSWKYYKGDVLVHMHQPGASYIANVLEPKGPDSFFAWNFFDGVLMQKEYFSPYVFEDTASELHSNNRELKEKFAIKKAEDPDFAGDANAQLRYIYEHSAHYELTHMLYPVGRILK